MKIISLLLSVIILNTLTACSSPPLPPEIDRNAPKIPISPMYQQ